jgi:tetratricopeptide (TPR) repeat protein
MLSGQNWKSAIRSAIRKSSFFLALMSSKSLTLKGYVQKELKVALEILDEIPPDHIFIIPVRIDECKPQGERLEELHWADLFPSYEDGLNQILKVLNRYSSSNQSERKVNIGGDTENRVLISGDGNIINLQERYDTLKLDDDSRERVLKEKVNIQKLLGQEYMKIEDYEKAEQSFRLALALAQQIKDFDYEKEEIFFLLNQVYYQP